MKKRYSFYYKYHKKRKLDFLFNLFKQLLTYIHKKRPRRRRSYTLTWGRSSKWFARRSSIFNISRSLLFFKNLIFSGKSCLWTRKFWFSLVILLFILSLMYIIFIDDFFKIKRIEITGLEKIKEEDIRLNVSGAIENQLFLFRNNLIFIRSPEIQKNLSKGFPRIASVIIEKEFPDKLMIEVKEREAIGIWCHTKYEVRSMKYEEVENDENKELVDKEISDFEASTPQLIEEECFYIDENGVIFDDAPQASGSLILVIKDLKEDASSVLGNEVISQQTLDFIQAARKEILKPPRALAIKEFLITGAGDVEIITTEGWKVFLDPSQDSSSDIIQILKELLEKEIGSARANLEYIDLRIPGRVYYK